MLRTEKFLTRKLASIQTVARSSLYLFQRHLVHAAKQIKPKGCSHLHTAFIDFKQAYDTIDRPHLWDHLNNIRMPFYLVNVIKQMYDGDEYVLIDGAKTTSTGNFTAP